mgnify:CR=1 FL=1
MFTGIIETLGRVKKIEKELENIHFTCMESKSIFLESKDFVFHLDDDDIELMDIFESNKFDQSKCFPVHVDHFEWKETCRNILKKKFS